MTSGKQSEISRETLIQMVAALSHRGPDDRGFYRHDGCGLGHARLSIIDLEGGRQPLFNEDQTVAVVANGEIYNFAQLRCELIGKGHRFRTNSDCEVLVHLWEQYGEDCVESLRGMYAFVLYDSKRKLLFGARDRFGQKPLFYGWNNGTFVFASEIKGLLQFPGLSPPIDLTALDQFLFYQFVPHPRTLFAGISQLPPAHTFLLTAGELKLNRYWQPPSDPQPEHSDQWHLEELEAALEESVQRHLVSDVPVGIFLSGGIDSSLIAAIASRSAAGALKSFSISFPEARYDESEFARLASRHAGTEHHEFCFQSDQIPERIEAFVTMFDQPIADRAVLPLLSLSEETAREVKVVLTGDGGDELFAGYQKYMRLDRKPEWARWIDTRLPHFFSSSELARCREDRFGLRKLRSRLALRYLPEAASSYFKQFWEGWDRQRLYAGEIASEVRGEFRSLDALVRREEQPSPPLDVMLRIDKAGYLPDDLLLKTDFATMAHGLEARAPLLDHRLAETAARLPMRLQATPSQTKVALRRIAEKWLPEELVTRPKRGFGVPLKSWFQRELRDWVRDCLITNSTTVPTYFRKDVVNDLLREHVAGKRNHAPKIFTLLVFELWHRKYMS